MKKISTDFEGLFILETNVFVDVRGSFSKLFNFNFFSDNELPCNFKEFYYSISKKNVIRGMHFQIPNMDHEKVVYISQGRIVDVVLDLRRSSKSYGRFFSMELNSSEGRYLYIPKGFAHGFMSLQDNTIVNYAQTSCYSFDHDAGIKYNSFGFDWNIVQGIVSERDNSFQPFSNFVTPFI